MNDSSVNGEERCNLYYNPNSDVNDVLGLINHGPAEPEAQAKGYEVQDPDSDVMYANVKLESTLLSIVNQTGAIEYFPCIAAFAIDTIGFQTELLIDYGYNPTTRIKFKPRHRQPFSRLQHMTSRLAHDEARNQGLRVHASMAQLGMECSLRTVLGPSVRDVPEEHSKRTGAVLLEAKMATVLDRSKSAAELVAARLEFRNRVLNN